MATFLKTQGLVWFIIAFAIAYDGNKETLPAVLGLLALSTLSLGFGGLIDTVRKRD